MSQPKPLLLTAVLSAAAVLTYGAYRVFLGAGDPPPLALSAAHDDRAESAQLADALPSIRLGDLDGQLRSLEDLGAGPMVINFWATWCAPCLREIPLLKSLQEEHPELRVVGIAIDEPDAVREFAAEIGFNYPILVGQGDAMDAATALGIDVFVLPSTVFTAATGHTLGIHIGEIHPEHLENLTATLAQLETGALEIGAARDRIAGRR